MTELHIVSLDCVLFSFKVLSLCLLYSKDCTYYTLKHLCELQLIFFFVRDCISHSDDGHSLHISFVSMKPLPTSGGSSTHWAEKKLCTIIHCTLVENDLFTADILSCHEVMQVIINQQAGGSISGYSYSPIKHNTQAQAIGVCVNGEWETNCKGSPLFNIIIPLLSLLWQR